MPPKKAKKKPAKEAEPIQEDELTPKMALLAALIARSGLSEATLLEQMKEKPLICEPLVIDLNKNADSSKTRPEPPDPPLTLKRRNCDQFYHDWANALIAFTADPSDATITSYVTLTLRRFVGYAIQRIAFRMGTRGEIDAIAESIRSKWADLPSPRPPLTTHSLLGEYGRLIRAVLFPAGDAHGAGRAAAGERVAPQFFHRADEAPFRGDAGGGYRGQRGGRGGGRGRGIFPRRGGARGVPFQSRDCRLPPPPN
jgi:hypothetical protein